MGLNYGVKFLAPPHEIRVLSSSKIGDTGASTITGTLYTNILLLNTLAYGTPLIKSIQNIWFSLWLIAYSAIWEFDPNRLLWSLNKNIFSQGNVVESVIGQ